MNGGSCNTGGETPVFDDPDVVVVLGGALADLQRAGDRLGQHDIEAAVVNPAGDDGCSSGGCSPKLYLVVARENAAAAFAVFEQDWKRGLTEEQLAALEAAASIVVDPDSGQITCPACLTTFETGPVDCPDCGLAIG